MFFIRPRSSRFNTVRRRARAGRPVLRGEGGSPFWQRAGLVLLATLSVMLAVAQQGLDANTRRNPVNASDYLTWLLRGEGARGEVQGERVVPGAALLSALPRRPSGDGPVLRMDMGITRAVIERVQEGDTLLSVLRRHGVARHTALEVVRTGVGGARRHKAGYLNRPFQTGRLLKLTFDQNDRLSSLNYPIDANRTLHVSRQEGGGFSSEIRKMPLGARSNEVYSDIPEEAPVRALPALPVAPSAQLTPLSVGDLFSGSARQVRDTVRAGDLLTTLLARHGVNQVTALQVAAASKPLFNLARLMKPGHAVRLAMDKEGQLLGVAYAMNSDTTLWVMRQGDTTGFKSHLQKKQFETRLQQASGSITDEGSLFLAGKQAGLSHTMVSRLANLFEWDIDFARDIRTGDQFRVVYEAKYHQGRQEREGEIVAAEFVNQGRVLQVVHYVDPAGNAGYYDANGESIRKMFIRAPVDFTRISSLFSKNRPHPIFGFTRAHKGVDYAAPQGTPVRAAAAGQVTFVGNKGEYGQFVTVRHNDTYSTAYAHLSGFARGLRVGSRVKQGEVLGRVGATGSATGPHLHYEVLVNEVQVNPLSIQQVTAGPIAARYAGDFRRKTARMLALLHGEETATKVAALPTTPLATGN
ncbi:MAG: peptidoglycan DD-metalloendopeptidase family protein [Magnetococcus sp. MYC-9]